MDTILVPVDFSPFSTTAARYAAEIARILRAKILLFHAYMLPAPVSEVPYVMITVDELQKENELAIKKDAERLGADFGIEVEWLVRIGIPSDETKLITEERTIGLVVLGMSGAGGLDKMIGSTTTNTVRKVNVPVLIIPKDTLFLPIRHVTYASDFSYQTSSAQFGLLRELCEKTGASIDVIHISRGEDTDKNPVAKQRMGKELGGIPHQFIGISDNSVMHGINSYLNTHASQILVMVAHKHSFFERVFSKKHTTSMAYETKIPLLVLQGQPS